MSDTDKPAAEAVPSPPDTPPPAIAPGKSYKSLATVSLVLALIGLFIFGLVLCPIAIILAAIARIKMGKEHNPDGNGIALAGLIVGIIGTVIPLIVIIIYIATRH